MINSAIMSQNSRANGYFALAFSVFHFACQSHVDVKRISCRLGMISHDKTARNALNSMTEKGQAALQASVASYTAKREVGYCCVLDNIQEYCLAREAGIGYQSVLKVGTAATAVQLEDCAPNAFNLHDHLSRVIKKERAELTTATILSDIDWPHLRRVLALHWVRILAELIPEFHAYQKEISARFRSDSIAKRPRRAGRKTEMQALGANAEREMEIQGMARAITDFSSQMGITEEYAKHLLLWIRGDGGSFATALRLKKYKLPTGKTNLERFIHIILTPEIWHFRATNVNTVASNHFGPVASDDPSSLSKAYSAANMKRPSDLRSCDFYPTLRGMTLSFQARVLDIFRQVK